jgi:hypothetical protein
MTTTVELSSARNSCVESRIMDSDHDDFTTRLLDARWTPIDSERVKSVLHLSKNTIAVWL